MQNHFYRAAKVEYPGLDQYARRSITVLLYTESFYRAVEVEYPDLDMYATWADGQSRSHYMQNDFYRAVEVEYLDLDKYARISFFFKKIK